MKKKNLLLRGTLMPFRILAIQVHTPFFYTLAKTLGEKWYFIPSSYTLAWGPERPLPKNCYSIDKKEALRMVKKGEIDLYIISREEQYLNDRLDIPTLFIEHNPTINKVPHFMDDTSVPVMMNSKGYATWIKKRGVKYFVYPDITLLSPLEYNGRKKQIIQVCKGFTYRPMASGYDVWNRVTEGLPIAIAGRFNEDIAEGIGYLDYKKIRRLYADSRVYFDTKIYWHSTAVQEAMYTGMPIVTIDTKAPFKNEKEIVKSRDEKYLRKRLEDLLDNREEAIEIGARGREAYLKLFRKNLKEWNRVWKKGIETAILLYSKRKEYTDKYSSLDSLLGKELPDSL